MKVLWLIELVEFLLLNIPSDSKTTFSTKNQVYIFYHFCTDLQKIGENNFWCWYLLLLFMSIFLFIINDTEVALAGTDYTLFAKSFQTLSGCESVQTWCSLSCQQFCWWIRYRTFMGLAYRCWHETTSEIRRTHSKIVYWESTFLER